MNTQDYSRIVFTPIEASNAAEQYVTDLRSADGDGMPLYIPNMEYRETDGKGFLPVNRDEIITVLGRPGNGKTGFMLRWARMRANDLKRRAEQGDETAKNSVVLYLTMEQLVEELRLFHVAAENGISATNIAARKLNDEQWDGVTKSLRLIHTTPLWFAGKSRKRRREKIKITEQSLYGALESIETWQGDQIQTQIDSVFVDYLQRFRPTQSEWVQFYGDLMNGLKEMTEDFVTRMIVGVQAKREVDKYNIPIPQMDDGQWSSGIEHQSDGMISVVRPSHYKREGEEFDDVIVNGKNQMLVTVLKRKKGPDNFKQWVRFEPEYNRLDEVELKSYNLRKQRGEDE